MWAFQLAAFLPGLRISACLVIHQSSLSHNRKVFVCALSLINTFSNPRWRAFLFSSSWADWKQSLPAFRSHWRTEQQFRLTLLYLPLILDNPLLPGLGLYPNPAILREVALPVLTHRVLRQQAVGPWLLAKLQAPDGEYGG